MEVSNTKLCEEMNVVKKSMKIEEKKIDLVAKVICESEGERKPCSSLVENVELIEGRKSLFNDIQ